MYIHLGRAEPAPRRVEETPGPVRPLALTQVLDTTSTPFRSICRIQARTAKGGDSVGSGVLISRYHVLTCAHVLFPSNDPDPREVTVLPGQNGPGDKRPRISSNGWAVSPGWRWQDCQTADQDLAIIRLARPSDADFWPVAPFDPSFLASLTGAAAYLAGYPSFREKDPAYWMYRSRGRVIGRIQINCCCEPTPHKKGNLNRTLWPDITDTTKLIVSEIDSRPSMSGGPIWTYRDGKPVLFALHAGDIDDGARKKAVLLGGAARNLIAYWTTRGLPPLPTGQR
jgi:hypothetical protein